MRGVRCRHRGVSVPSESILQNKKKSRCIILLKTKSIGKNRAKSPKQWNCTVAYQVAGLYLRLNSKRSPVTNSVVFNPRVSGSDLSSALSSFLSVPSSENDRRSPSCALFMRRSSERLSDWLFLLCGPRLRDVSLTLVPGIRTVNKNKPVRRGGEGEEEKKKRNSGKMRKIFTPRVRYSHVALREAHLYRGHLMISQRLVLKKSSPLCTHQLSSR